LSDQEASKATKTKYRDWSSKAHARYMPLSGVASTDEAKAFIGALVSYFTESKPRSPRAQMASKDKLFDAIAAITADLFASAATQANRLSYRNVRPAAFSRQPVPYRSFVQAMEFLQSNAYVEVLPGGYSRDGGFEAEPDGTFIGDTKTKGSGRGLATRYRATSKLMELGSIHGVTPNRVNVHFKQRVPHQRIVLRPAKLSNLNDLSSRRDMSFEWSDLARSLDKEVSELNDFLASFTFENCERQGYYRVFNGGDRADFQWNLGGRLFDHARKESFQLLSDSKRLNILINGSKVEEVDVRGSHITILHGLRGHEPDWLHDPYEMPDADLPRGVIKYWMTISLGHWKFHSKWPDGTAKHLGIAKTILSRKYPIKAIEKKMLQRYPILQRYHQTASIHQLMFVESQIILDAMKGLASIGIPSLSVHDSLIVRESDTKHAIEQVTVNFRKHTNLCPWLKVSKQGGLVDYITPEMSDEDDARSF
jgi:hypothetical protein